MFDPVTRYGANIGVSASDRHRVIARASTALRNAPIVYGEEAYGFALFSRAA
jgi:hypothetical protein